MLNIDDWMTELMDKLSSHFGDRLLFVGLQGSHQREEAHRDSDIDAVVILDTLSMDDLIAYRAILLTMPENEKSCGFISGKNELMHWPRHELFQFKMDTRPCLGELDSVLPDIERKDVLDGVKISASALYHACCHAAVHSPFEIGELKGMYKSAFFLLQALHYVRCGVYVRTKKELLPKLDEDEYNILEISMNWSAYSGTILEKPDDYFKLMLSWSAAILNADF